MALFKHPVFLTGTLYKSSQLDGGTANEFMRNRRSKSGCSVGLRLRVASGLANRALGGCVLGSGLPARQHSTVKL